jgi:putative ABC transport system permease protein
MRLGDLTRLFRFPGLLQALLGAALILGLVSASSSLFLSSTASATLHRLAGEEEDEVTAALQVVVDSSISKAVIGYRSELLKSELDGLVGQPILTARGDEVDLRSRDEDEVVRIVSRTGALNHVQRLERVPGPGVWLTDFTAGDLGVRAGDRITVANLVTSTRVRVAGIYRDVYTQPRSPYWAPLDQFIYPPPGANTRPPLFMLVELDQYIELEEQLQDDQDVISWEFPIDTSPTSIEASRAYVDRLTRFRVGLSDSSTELGSAFPRVSYSEPMTGWLGQAGEVVGSIRGPVETLSIAGRAVALAVLAGAGLFMIGRRRVELSVLNARGIGPVRLGVRSATEALLPVALGAAAGWGIAIAAIGALEPTGILAPGALREAAVTVAVTALVAVCLLGVVSANAAREQTEHGADRVRRWTSRFPWELLLLVLAGVALSGLRARGASAQAAEAVPELDRLLLLFPILFLAGAAGLCARGLRYLLPWVRRLGSRWRPASYLASRRLAAAPRLATSLVVASALSVGILVYAATLSASVRATADLDAALLVGSDVSIRVSGLPTRVAEAPFPATPVVRMSGVSFVSQADTDLDVLAVDPATFPVAASWQPEFADAPLEELMGRIRGEGASRLPVVVAGSIESASDPVLDLPGYEIPLTVVGRARAFPGKVGERHLLVVSQVGLESALVAAGSSLERFADSSELWARASEDDVRAFLDTSGTNIVSSVSADDLRSTPRYLALLSMFRLLEALGVLAGVVVAMGTVLYLQTRQRQSEAAYALARRMGLSSGSHRWSVALEMAGLLVASFVIGGTLAVASALVVNGEVQARPVEAALPLFRFPILVVGVLAGTLVLFAWASAAVVQRRADRSDVVEVMRLAE